MLHYLELDGHDSYDILLHSSLMDDLSDSSHPTLHQSDPGIQIPLQKMIPLGIHLHFQILLIDLLQNIHHHHVMIHQSSFLQIHLLNLLGIHFH